MSTLFFIISLIQNIPIISLLISQVFGVFFSYWHKYQGLFFKVSEDLKYCMMSLIIYTQPSEDTLDVEIAP